MTTPDRPEPPPDAPPDDPSAAIAQAARRQEIIARRREAALGELSRLQADGVRGASDLADDAPEPEGGDGSA